MAVTGATFNFNKTVTVEEKPSTAAEPTDSSKLDTKMAGEKKGGSSTKEFLALSMVMNTVQSTVNTTLQNVEGTRLSEQIGAMQSIATTTVALGFMAATNPYALVATLALKGISYGFKADKFNRDKAWQDYDISEYNDRRGYSIHRSRTRSN